MNNREKLRQVQPVGDKLPSPYEDAWLCETFDILDKTGSGLVGDVWIVRHRATQKKCALKRILLNSNALTTAEKLRANFDMVGPFDHPNIVRSLDLKIMEARGMAYWTMEVLQGEVLRDWLARNYGRPASGKNPAGWVPLNDVLGICGQFASALDYAHTFLSGTGKPMEIAPGESAPYKGIIHGDLKPSNAMVLHGQEHAPGIPRVKLIDFGFAMFVPGRAQILRQPLKGSHLLIGSRFYRAPEQWGQEKVAAAADQWSLAVMIYEMASGYKPFGGSTREATRELVLKAEPRRPEALSEHQWKALQRALQRDPEQRYPSCGALIEALAEMLDT